MTGSLHRRLLLIAAVVTLAFTAMASLALEQAFERSALAAQRDRLRGHVHTLLAALRVEAERIAPASGLPEPRFAQPGSGLYAWIITADGRIAWRSRSTAAESLPAVTWQPPGTVAFDRTEGYFRLDYGVVWEPVSGPERRFSITLIESATAFHSQVTNFRRALWGWLGTAAVGLLLALWLAMRWGLRPLHRVSAEVAGMRDGRQGAVQGDYPREIAPLTENINRLADAERERTRRYRQTLDNLAHSLKTPLAVIRGALASRDPDELAAASGQVGRIDRQIEYYVRGSGAGQLHGGGRTPVRTTAKRLAEALRHAHAQRPRSFELDCPEDLGVAGTEDDLMEMLGNIMDNAWRYGHSRVHMSAEWRNDAQPMVLIHVDDDGPGIPEAVRSFVLARGNRLHDQTAGEGIGLSVAAELAERAGGGLRITTAPGLGGARVSLVLPGYRGPGRTAAGDAGG